MGPRHSSATTTTTTTTTEGEDASYDDVLSPEETYEGSRHLTVCLDADVAEVAEVATSTTAVISPVLLDQLCAELREQAAREPPSTRPTQRMMPAIRPGETRRPK